MATRQRRAPASNLPAVPVNMPQLGRNQMPVAGKIKMGVKVPIAGKDQSRPKATDTFRFTSNDRDSLELLAAKYGGAVAAFNDPKSAHKFQLLTESGEIAVVLPPNPLGDSPVYEKFGGKGMERRCMPWLEAPQCETEQPGPDGPEPIIVPCICQATNAAKADRCKPTTRLRVLLPECRMAGVWELVSHSEQAANEMPTMVQLVENAGPHGLTHARVKIDSRESRGGTAKYKMPVLFLAVSIEELVAGHASLSGATVAKQIQNPPRPELGPAPVESGATEPATGSAGSGAVSAAPQPASAPDSNIVDATIVGEKVDDETLASVGAKWADLDQAERHEVRRRQAVQALPSKANEMTPDQAMVFASIIESVISERPFD